MERHYYVLTMKFACTVKEVFPILCCSVHCIVYLMILGNHESESHVPLYVFYVDFTQYSIFDIVKAEILT